MSVSSAGHGDYTWKVDDARGGEESERRGVEVEVVDGGGRGGRIVGKRETAAVFFLTFRFLAVEKAILTARDGVGNSG